MPSQLFKYRRWRRETPANSAGSSEAVNYTESLFSSHTLFCQRPMGFDDPHDGHAGAVHTGSVYDLGRYALENMRSLSNAMRAAGLTSLTQLQRSSRPEVRAAIAEGAARQVRRESFVLSFSTVGDEDVMWSFYAETTAVSASNWMESIQR